MNPRPVIRLWPVVLALAAAASLEAALIKGGVAYSKSLETKLLAEPKPSAAVAGKIIGYAKKLSITDAQGAWLQISDAGSSGWLFKGAVAETLPEKIKGLTGFPIEASKTTATDAARPLTPEAEAYASRRNLAGAKDDVDWMLKQCTAITNQSVDDFLKANQRGEYQ
jgi:hypothetical protein